MLMSGGLGRSAQRPAGVPACARCRATGASRSAPRRPSSATCRWPRARAERGRTRRAAARRGCRRSPRRGSAARSAACVARVRTACGISSSESRTRIRSALVCASAEPRPIAIATSAPRSSGASLMPSPTATTTAPADCSALTRASLPSGLEPGRMSLDAAQRGDARDGARRRRRSRFRSRGRAGAGRATHSTASGRNWSVSRNAASEAVRVAEADPALAVEPGRRGVAGREARRERRAADAQPPAADRALRCRAPRWTSTVAAPPRGARQAR